MRRREFISLLSGSVFGCPLIAKGQQPTIPVIGFLSTLSPSNLAANAMDEFHRGLKEVGFVEGQNVKIEYRWAEGHYDRLPELAADLVHRQVAVIAATGGEPSPQVVKAATQSIPIVFMANGDPVAAGLVARLNRPGGNLTGVTIFGMMAAGKRLELLHQLMPKVGTIAYLMNPNNPNSELDNVQTAARSLGQQILVLNADSDQAIVTAFATIAQQRVAALLVASDPLFFDLGGPSGDTSDLLPPRIPAGWRALKLRKQPDGYVSPCRNIHGSHPERRKTSRPTSDAGNQVRVGHQLKDCDGTWPHRAVHVACPCERGDRVRRRDLIAFLGSLAAAWPLAAIAQQKTRMHRIGILSPGRSEAPDPTANVVNAFLKRLHELGYTQGRNIAVVRQYAEGNSDRLRELAYELIRDRIDIVVALSTTAALAAKQENATIPIVAIGMADPVADELVISLGRPGGNVTGTSFVGPELVAKRLQLLREMVPGLSRVAALWHPNAYSKRTMAGVVNEIEVAARGLGLRLQLLPALGPDDIAGAFTAMARERADALIVTPSPMLFSAYPHIASMAASNRLPAMGAAREFADLGGLMSYGANLPELARQTAAYVDKILKGATPAELPVEQPSKYELVLNLNAAKALGITIPQSLLIQADEVIE